MSNHKIMIVEDEKIVSEDIRASIEKMGYSACAAASSGKEAIEKAGLIRPDLILMDIVLTGSMDGIEAATQINDLYKIPVVYLTAFGGEDILQRAKVAEPYGYITKPFNERELHIAIEIALYKKQAEARITKMEQWLATVLRSIGDAVVALDKEHRITFMNAVAENLTGWSREDAIGNKLTEVLNIKDQDLGDLEKHLLENVLTRGLIINLIEDRLLIAKDGAEVPISDSVAPIKEDKGEVSGSVLIFRDITKSKQADEALKKNQLLLAETERIGNVGGWEFNIDTGKQIWTEQIYKIHEVDLTFDPTVEIGVSFYTPASRPIIERAVQRAIDAGEPFDVELEIITAKGNLRCVNAIGKADLESRRVYGFFQYITDRKRAEEELRRHREKLEVMVAERTAQLSATNKELEAFSYSVSHDLRTPLRSIDGFSKALLEEYQEKLDDTGKSFLERVCKATQRMGLLIDDMLKLSRITQAEMKRGAVDLSGMVREITEAHQKSNPDRAVDVTVQEGIVVQGDPYLLKIAMENLVGNAFKFTGKEAHPRIELGAVNKDGETCYFIRDNGAGFDMTYVGKLFSAFQRLHASDEFPGTGIGLATVQRIIARHGGRVWAEGEIGKGATFYFTLPL